MFTLYPRHLFYRFFGLLLLALGCTTVIFLVIDIVENVKFWIARPEGDAVIYYVNYIPYILYLILPIALLIASVFAVGGASKHLELVAMRSSGSSYFSVFLPLLIFGMLISGGMYYFNNTILPEANYKRFRIKEPMAPENRSGNPNEKYKFVFIGPDNVTYFFQHYSGNSRRGRDVTILVERGDTLAERYDAKTLHWENQWVLSHGLRREFVRSQVKASPFDRLELPQIKDTPEDLINNRIFPEEMTRAELDRRIDILKRSGEPTRRYETQLHFKIASCAIGFIMVLFGLSFSTNVMKSGLTKKFGLALLLAFSYFILIRFGLTMGENGAVRPLYGAWMANVFFGGLGLLLFLRTIWR